MKPTEEDVRRDLESDLCLCQAAAPGPWSSSPQKGIPGHCYVAQVWDALGDALACVEPTVKEGDASATAAMIAAAREGWPAAVRRAIWAENEVARLRKIVEGLTDRVAQQSELLSKRAERVGE